MGSASRNEEHLGGRIEGELLVCLSSDVLLSQDVSEIDLLDMFAHFSFISSMAQMSSRITETMILNDKIKNRNISDFP